MNSQWVRHILFPKFVNKFYRKCSKFKQFNEVSRELYELIFWFIYNRFVLAIALLHNEKSLSLLSKTRQTSILFVKDNAMFKRFHFICFRAIKLPNKTDRFVQYKGQIEGVDGLQVCSYN